MTPLLLDIAGPEDFAAAFDVSRETLERLETYAALLERWQRVQNLVAPNTLAQVWQRHFADSAQLLALAPQARKWVDIGTGAGFPGLVIAILLANRPECGVHLIESNARKCAFLGEVARETEATVTIHNVRVESLDATSPAAGADVVTARALAPLERLIGYAAPLFGPATRGLFLKGRQAGEEIEAARKAWTFRTRLFPSLTEAGGTIVEITEPRRTTAG
jgi:16S rRNA (guanine527-N7)-methyltransferase